MQPSLHYTTNQDICGQEEVVLIDAGAEYRGYASDITAFPWPISGKFSDAQRGDLYQIVLDAQEAPIEACQVGAVYTAPHDVARRALAEGLIKLGVITQTIDDALDMDTGQLKPMVPRTIPATGPAWMCTMQASTNPVENHEHLSQGCA